MKTLEDVDAALSALAQHEAEAATLRAEQEAEIASVRDEVLAKRANRLQQLTQAIDELRADLAKWAGRRIYDHLPEGSKTLALPHGTLSLRKQRDKIDYVDGYDEAKTLERLQKRFPISTTIAHLLASAWKALRLSDVVRLKLTVDKTAALKAAANGASAALREVGLRVVTGDDELTIEAAPR